MKILLSLRHSLLLALGGMFLAGALITGCATEPGPEPPIRTPGTGSSYKFSNHAKDTTGAIIPNSETRTTRTIISTNTTLMGESNVVQFRETNDTSTNSAAADTVSMHYEANGDVKLFQPAITFPNDDFPAPPGVPFPNISIPARWVLFGFTSKSQVTIPSYDTTVNITFSGFPISLNVKATGTTSYIGTEDLMIGGEKVATQKGLLTVNMQLSAALLFSGSFKTTDTVWFAPKLGMIVKDDAITTSVLPAQFGPSGIVGGTHSVLTSYTIK